MSAKPIPDGYDALIPSVIVRDAAKAIEFYKDVFGARTTLQGSYGTVYYYSLAALKERGVQNLDHLPFTVRIILENMKPHYRLQ